MPVVNADSLIPITWQLREMEALPPSAVAIAGSSGMRAICSSLLSLRDDASLQQLRFVVANDWQLLIILGPVEQLPWCENAVYLGAEEDSGIYMPTVLKPSVPAALVEKALLKKLPGTRTPFAVLPALSAVVYVGESAPVSRTILEQWIAKWNS